MLLRLSSIEGYKSIPQNWEAELSTLSVLTGENGSGKTQIFEGILAGKIYAYIEERTLRRQEIEGYLYNSLVYTGSPNFDSNSFTSGFEGMLHTFRRKKEGKGFEGQDSQTQAIISQLAKMLNKRINDLTEQDLRDNRILFVKSQEKRFFSAEISKIYMMWNILYTENAANRAKATDKNNFKGDFPFRTDEEFFETFGEPPWKIIDEKLKALGLNFISSNPDSNPNFKVMFSDSSGNKINPDDLSTGEKVILMLALAGYGLEGELFCPSLILFDEPDAPLHPNMSILLMNTIQEIHEKRRVSIIMATHSVSTIAVAPQRSIYKLCKNTKEIEKCDFQDAIKNISHSIPNFRISRDNKRLVFVESIYDAKNYLNIFQILSQAKLWPTQVEPNFIPASIREGSNCSDVKHVLAHLESNPYIFGLIDFDLTNKTNGNLVVLGSRYSHENYILDPILLGLFMLRFHPEKVNFSKKYKYFSDETLQVDIQGLSSYVQDFVSQCPDTVSCYLINGFEIQIKKEILDMNGHNLEKIYKNVFPWLGQYQRENDLKSRIIQSVCNDFPGYMSKDLRDVFANFV